MGGADRKQTGRNIHQTSYDFVPISGSNTYQALEDYNMWKFFKQHVGALDQQWVQNNTEERQQNVPVQIILKRLVWEPYDNESLENFSY